MKKKRIFIVEDEFIVANDLRDMLLGGGYEVCGIAASVEQARKMIPEKEPDWVLVDIMLKTETTGITLGKELLAQKIPFLYISANTNQQMLEAAKATQPYGFLVKPFRERDLFVMLDIAAYRYDVETGKIKARDTAKNSLLQVDTGIIGNSAALTAALEKVHSVAGTNTSVLLMGESGTGKERFAQAVHKLSARRNKPFVTVNCAALPVSLIESELFGHERGAFTGASQKRMGKFEQANNGTIFLDEIGELPPEAQIKLLRVLQEREIERLGNSAVVKVDVRVIAATNRNLEKEVATGRFRLDLYYRLNIFPIELPPLRNRKADIPLLAQHFLTQYCQSVQKHISGITQHAMAKLQAYEWPGNIRELEHVIERSVILAQTDAITEIELPSDADMVSTPGSGPLETLEEMERNHILKALKLSSGRVSGKSGAAEMLGILPQTLYSKMKKLGIQTRYQ
ncbi:DNA-binding NtrC family response regulator [Filimonas zeae]|uniref:Sigma-54-dependent Fis family transcriptional regulator n=1 Tax=Filimonas zeae TaxID=1737353 RepID=A0A917IZT0_9BACT|nr:sigma-54 dependent transcriptional regulator [Filimonas zeae]MDR6340315.1 DNA-binding NtrC family response regulator [Filimonas zeae]GGH72152.1 hypothetical protein GCM10011379_32270 [Filimonas zeae]